jgi:phosphoglycerate kinase
LQNFFGLFFEKVDKDRQNEVLYKCKKKIIEGVFFFTMNKKTVKDVNVKGKKVLVRCDFNVPMKDGAITDENRIQGALPTIQYLMGQGAKVILCSHMGKPHNVFDDKLELNKKEKAKIAALPEAEQAAATSEALEKAKKDVKKLTLAPVAARLNELLGGKVTFASDVVGPDAKAKVAACKEGECVLLENLRFHKGEEKKSPEFMKALASYCDVYVNDAFGTAHRSHASTAGIVEEGLVKTAVCGFLIEKELSVMADTLENPERPFLAILGGAKVADKLNVISNLLEKCDTLIIGGGMAYTFIKAQGGSIGTSLVDDEKLDYCKEMLEKAKKLGKEIVLPVDSVAAKAFPDPIDAPIETTVVLSTAIPDDMMGLDIGPETRKLFASVVAGAKSIIWNGPMGVFENPILAEGTKAVAEALASVYGKATTIIGGGDSAAAVQQLGFADKMSHISTGGGASLELFEGKALPGIECLNDKD